MQAYRRMGIVWSLMVFAVWSWAEAAEWKATGAEVPRLLSQEKRSPSEPQGPSPEAGKREEGPRAGAPLSSEGPLKLSLRDSVGLALKYNLDLAIEGFNPQIRETEVISEESVFDPSAFAELSMGKSVSQSLTFNILSTPEQRRDEQIAIVGIRQLLPTGATYELRLGNDRLNINPPVSPFVSSFDPANRSTVTLTLTQPLLKDFGPSVNRTRINLARNNMGISQEQLKNRVNEVITSAEQAYWDLVASIQNLEAQRRSLRLAKELMDLNKARVRAGVAAPVEVTEAEAEVAAREHDVIVAEKGVKDAEDRLKLILNAPNGDRAWDLSILPTDKPSFRARQMALDKILEEALQKRPEVQSAKLEIANRDLNLRLTKHQLLPRLNLQGTVGVDLLEHRYDNPGYNFTTGVIVEVPFGNRAARADYLKAKLEADQARISLQNIERTITAEVREAVRRVEADAKRVNSSRAARALAEEQLRVEQKRLEAGVTTTFNVLRFQRDLTEAEATEISAIADYNKSLSNIEKVKGTSIERYGFEFRK